MKITKCLIRKPRELSPLTVRGVVSTNWWENWSEWREKKYRYFPVKLCIECSLLLVIFSPSAQYTNPRQTCVLLQCTAPWTHCNSSQMEGLWQSCGKGAIETVSPTAQVIIENVNNAKVFKAIFLAIFKCMFVRVRLWVYMWTRTHECTCPWRNTIALELDSQADVNCLMWMLGTDTGPRQEQEALLTTEPSLQLQTKVFLIKVCTLF